jgi:hypothetical protein
MSWARCADVAPNARRERPVIGMIGSPATALKQTRSQNAKALTIPRWGVAIRLYPGATP